MKENRVEYGLCPRDEEEVCGWGTDDGGRATMELTMDGIECYLADRGDKASIRVRQQVHKRVW